MSEAREKETRRNLRRVLGEEARVAFERQSEAVGFTTTAVRLHQDAIHAQNLELGELKLRVDVLADLAEQCARLHANAGALQTITTAIVGRRLWGRMRWFFRG